MGRQTQFVLIFVILLLFSASPPDDARQSNAFRFLKLIVFCNIFRKIAAKFVCVRTIESQTSNKIEIFESHIWCGEADLLADECDHQNPIDVVAKAKQCSNNMSLTFILVTIFIIGMIIYFCSSGKKKPMFSGKQFYTDFANKMHCAVVFI